MTIIRCKRKRQKQVWDCLSNCEVWWQLYVVREFCAGGIGALSKIDYITGKHFICKYCNNISRLKIELLSEWAIILSKSVKLSHWQTTTARVLMWGNTKNEEKLIIIHSSNSWGYCYLGVERFWGKNAQKKENLTKYALGENHNVGTRITHNSWLKLYTIPN